MLSSTSELLDYELRTIDGETGHVADFLFDDHQQIVRYIVVRTGGWLSGQETLISPVSIRNTDPDQRILETVLTRQAIQEAPGIDSHRPVSRRYESQLVAYYNWPSYWTPVATPIMTNHGPAITEEPTADAERDANLRSVAEIQNYSIDCIDGSIGHVEHLMLDTDTWVIRYLVIDTRKWLPGRKVIVSFDWLRQIHWEDRTVFVDLKRQQIETAPAFDPDSQVTREYEKQLHDWYGRRSYW